MNNEITIPDLISSQEELEPETLYQLFPKLSPEDIEKILVIKVILQTNFVHKDFDVFENAVQVLNDISPDVEKMEGILPEMAWKAIDIINKIRKEKFSNEVKEYVKFHFNDAGIYFYPPGMFSKDENPLYAEVLERATNGPFPLKDDKIGIQASKYLYIKEKIK